ncbi:20462_t:CDS:2, partial [Gigaspora margarita]
AAKNWSNESYEIKQLYDLLSDYAKQVHNMMYPHYIYKPKRPLTGVGSRKKNHVPSARNAKSTKSKQNWASRMASIPLINFIACLILKICANNDNKNAATKEDDAKLTEKVADIVQFVEHELSLLTRNLHELKAQIHYEKCNAEMKTIINGCRYYIS